MPSPDNDKTSAVKKVVDAFRARREGDAEPAPTDPAAQTDSGRTDAGQADSEQTGDETTVIKIEPGQAPGGGDSDSPTKAFAVPTAAAAAGADTEEVSLDGVNGEDTATETDGSDDESGDTES